jgi:hypothetical protein
MVQSYQFFKEPATSIFRNYLDDGVSTVFKMPELMYRNTRCHISKGSNLHSHCHKNPKSHIISCIDVHIIVLIENSQWDATVQEYKNMVMRIVAYLRHARTVESRKPRNTQATIEL